MAALYKRGRIWWVKFRHRGQVIRRSTKTSNRQLARERGRVLSKNSIASEGRAAGARNGGRFTRSAQRSPRNQLARHCR